MAPPDLVVVSNRGPLAFTDTGDGRQVATRGGGGLVAALGSVVSGSGATWIAAAGPEGGPDGGLIEAEGFRVRPVGIDADRYRRYYDVVANATLWFLHHHLFDLARRPGFDRRWRSAWDSFVSVNDDFAHVVADEAPDGATVVVHDYHLPLVGQALARLRPDLATAHFHHTPFCDPDALSTLPDDVAAQMLEGMAGFGACGFHATRWAAAFEDCCRVVLGRVPPTFVSPAPIDAEGLARAAASEECQAEAQSLDELVGGRQFLVRVDRIELSKNLLRGFLAFDELLDSRPRWREQVVFGAFVYPSRQTLPQYLAYRAEVETLVARINARWATPGWTPIVLDTSDRYARSVAALRRADVLVVNPVRDGLNLVAKEGTVLNERDAVVVLSRQAGAWDELGGAALGLNPFDVSGTAEVIDRALVLAPEERARRAAELRRASTRRTPGDWLRDHCQHARAPGADRAAAARPAPGGERGS